MAFLNYKSTGRRKEIDAVIGLWAGSEQVGRRNLGANSLCTNNMLNQIPLRAVAAASVIASGIKTDTFCKLLFGFRREREKKKLLWQTNSA